jgi:hypothetical protein
MKREAEASFADIRLVLHRFGFENDLKALSWSGTIPFGLAV